ELRDVLPEQREGRVGDNDVRLFEQLDAFLASEVAAPREACTGVGVLLEEELDVFDTSRAVSVDVLHFLNFDGNRLRPLAFAIALVIFTKRELCAGDGGAVVAGGDEL